MQDIVPKKSIREITKPHVPGVATPQSRYVPTEVKKVLPEDRDALSEYPHAKYNMPRKEKGRGWMLGVFAAILLVGIGVFLHFQKSATIYITPSQETLTFNNTEINIPLSELTFLSATTTHSIDIITATGSPVLIKAKGIVTIFNTNSTEQLLVANTRLETPNGKIYRLDNRVTVPKASLVGGKTTPGSIQVAITADKPGESYNVAQADFTFPGLLGSPRYKSVYARSKSSLAGGKEAVTKIINEKDKNLKIDALIKENTTTLNTKLETLELSGAVTIQKPSIATTFEKVSDTKGTVTFVNSMSVIDAKKLATLLTKNQKPNILYNTKFTDNQNNITVTYVSSDKTSVQVKVQGSSSVAADIDTEALKTLLADKPFTAFREIAQNTPGIKESRFSSKPFWATTFPQASHISIEQK